MDGRDMLFGNGPEYSAETLTFRVRMFAGMLALLLALFVFLAAREMFGLGAGFLSLAMLVFEPNVIAHNAFYWRPCIRSIVMPNGHRWHG
jgi:hypothetical protein